jgi:hypothetical protein
MPRFWFTSEYLLWKVQGSSVPVLAGAITGVELNPVRVLPDGTIRPLFGGSAGGIDYGAQSGFRINGGCWLDAESQWGLDAAYSQLFQGRDSFAAAALSTGTTSVGPTFFDPVVSREILILSGIPGFREGGVAIDANNRLWSAEGNVRCALPTPAFLNRLDLLAGFRVVAFDESLNAVSTSDAIPNGRLPICGCLALHYTPGVAAPSTPGPVGDEVVSWDGIGTRNRFYGPQVGMVAGTSWRALSLTAVGKVALGILHSEADLDGTTSMTTNGQMVQIPGGVLVQASNRGHYTDDRFAAVPEVGIVGGWEPFGWLRLTLGYNFLYLSGASRAAKLVDGVDSRQVPQLNSYDPAAASGQRVLIAVHSGVWVQGLTAGLEVRF